MRWRTVIIALMTMLTAGVANPASDSSSIKYSEWFFPETRAWIPVSKFAPMDLSYFSKARDALRAAYNKAEGAQRDESKDCSLISGILNGKEIHKFRIGDIDLDGLKDVIYTGNAFCHEGSDTLIWYGTKNGYQLVLNQPWSVLLLKIQIAKDPRFSTVDVGCCDNPIDTYYVGDLSNPRIGGSAMMYRSTADPNSTVFDERQFNNESETVLRSAPIINDRYDVDESAHQDFAVFGNILCKYLKGAKGRVIFSQRDKAQRQWAYVVMSQESNPLRYHMAYPANVGWILLNSAIPPK
ncbi:MAG TPA: hypothetical protein VMG30_17600 [Acidobacteriota bacterium]|nr:hypothetical protein [Acidobacteriota bacterium]